ncbi:YihY/virulence factor BrkB family protein [Haloarchaeobius sp. HME9146]|uniref:YihY/virulence factor BrkB family protein n=1 Tax=Haloarchaeobius sp. HME9146 TaxID=2978732 RepID=UPI0021BF5A43|nr:YihY/virulence factor BrkB family protein [Haloarchaeobius sp. HME9146]
MSQPPAESLPPRLQRAKSVTLAVVSLAQAEQLTFLAAAIAYYAFVSLIPLVLLAIAVATSVGGEALAAQVAEAASNVLTPASQDVLRDVLTATEGRSATTVVGLGVLIWSSLKVFRGMDQAFSEVYGNGNGNSFVDELTDAAVGLAAVGAAAFIAVAAITVVQVVDFPFESVVGPVVSLLALAFAFYPLYYLFPDEDVRWREAVPGALFAAAGWTVMGVIFNLYAGYAGATSLYGFFGAILLLVTWLYLGAMMLLLGTALNAVLAGQTANLNPDLSAAVDRHLQTAGLRQEEPTEDDA